MSNLVVPVAPSFTWQSVINPTVLEIVTTYNAESIDALNQAPAKDIAWADIGTKVTPGMGIVKVPVRLPSSLFFEDFDGKRNYQNIDIFAPVVKVSPKQLNFRWPMVWGGPQMGASWIGSYGAGGTVQEFMGIAGLAQGIQAAARAHKAYLAATACYTGFTSSTLGATATTLTYPQPGFPNGLPLFSNAANAGAQYAHPVNPNSDRFDNFYEGVGTFNSYFAQSIIDMNTVPHPSMPQLTLGLQVTDVIGPTWMQKTFWNTAIQMLALQAQTSPFNGVAATTNPYSAEALAKINSASFIGASGLAPWRFWTTPLLNKHPYYWNAATNTATSHMTDGAGGGPSDLWLSVSHMMGDVQTWLEFAGPSKEFTPKMTLFGDGDPQSIAERQIRMLGDLDAGYAAGLPHFAKLYFEKNTAP